jgi:hypothetical protein
MFTMLQGNLIEHQIFFFVIHSSHLFASNIGKASLTAQPKSEVSQQIAAPQQPSKVQLSAPSPPLAVVQSRSYPHWSQLIIGAGFIAAVGAGTGYLFQVNDASFFCQLGYHMLVNIGSKSLLIGRESWFPR